MKSLQMLSLGLALAIAAATGTARAEQVPQGVLVYFGTAEFAGSSAGLTVGPYSNASECEAALDAAIDNAVNNQGYTIESIEPCMPHWNLHDGGLPELEAAPFTVAVLADSPGESLDVARLLMKEVALARRTYRAAEFESTLQAIAKAAITDPLRKKETR
ncbi:hypothetical protein [Lysobacter hankyongensis]|uniref:DUF4189 domain-containing protein n=1 Tax=Lysobacter hankyongensis TaxID=1176535 RepID=A0ABP9BI92_9GAMM